MLSVQYVSFKDDELQASDFIYTGVSKRKLWVEQDEHANTPKWDVHKQTCRIHKHP